MRKLKDVLGALAAKVGEGRWKQVTVILKTGERQVWHEARLRKFSPHVWTIVELRDGRIMLYPRGVVLRVGLGRGRDPVRAKMYG